jgi:thioredoxin reductase (NADPH)
VKHVDLVVIGAGLAGLTAAMFGGRYGLRVAVIDEMGTAGQVLNTEQIENFPGFPQGIAGADLGPLVQEQAERAGAEFILDTARSLELDGPARIVHCAQNDLTARAVIIAAGSRLRPLGIPGEARLMGKGVSHCASCDGPFFSGGDVCVVGGGDSALDEAAVLAGYASRVTVVHHGPALTCQKAVLDKAVCHTNVEIRLNTTVEEIIGNGTVSSVRLRHHATDAVTDQPVAGVFIYVGLEPNTGFVRGVLDVDNSGHVVTDVLMRTSAPGVFAAGDIRQHSVAQLAAAAGDGATAAIAAFRYIRGQEAR